MLTRLLGRLWHTWDVPGGTSKRSSRVKRATWGRTSTRPAPGRAGITHCVVPGGGGLPVESATGLGGERCPGSAGRRCTAWCARCCPGSGSGRRSCYCGSSSLSYATSGRAAPTRDAAPPAERAGRSLHPELVVVVLDRGRRWPKRKLEPRENSGETTMKRKLHSLGQEGAADRYCETGRTSSTSTIIPKITWHTCEAATR